MFPNYFTNPSTLSSLSTLKIDSDFGIWRNRTLDHLTQRGVRHYFVDSDGQPLLSDLAPPPTLVLDTVPPPPHFYNEIEMFHREHQRAISTLFKALNSCFAASSAELELKRASVVLMNSQQVNLSSVKECLAQVFRALSTYRRHKQDYPIAAILNLVRRTLPSEFHRTFDNINIFDRSILPPFPN